MGRQTTVQEKNAIRFGSGKFEVKPEGGEYINLGAMREIEFEETWEKVRVMSDNAGAIVLGIRNHQAALKGQMMEINLEKLKDLRGGLDTYETQAGTKETDVDQAVQAGSWSFGKFIKIENQNHDLGEITITTVKGNSTTYTADTEYSKVQDASGNWGIIVIDGENDADEAHALTINYEYTPAAHKSIQSGHTMSINPVAVRVVNTNEDDKEFIIEVFKATTEDGITLSLPADDDEDPAMVPINLMGEVDTAGETNRLFKIYDYQT